MQAVKLSDSHKVYRFRGCDCRINVFGYGNFISQGPPPKCELHGNLLATKKEAMDMEILDICTDAEDFKIYIQKLNSLED